MKYINKEYGFAFRPPFFDKFYEESEQGVELTENNFPAKYMQGVGYDYSAINGAMLVGKYGSLWGIRVQCYVGNRWLDSNDFLLNLNSSCANTSDGSFAHFASGSLSVKWVRHNEQSLIIQVSCLRRMRVRIIFYPCYGYKGEISIEGSQVSGRSPFVGIVPGEIKLTDTNAIFKNRYLVIDEGKPCEFFRAVSYSVPSDTANGAFNEGIMEFVINKQQPSVYVYATIGDESIFDSELPRLDKVIGQIETAELRYGVNKTIGSGLLSAGAERMINSVLWSRIYYPYLLTEIYSPQRSRLDNNFDIQGVEENCATILGAYANLESAKRQLQFTLEDRILAVMAVWHVFAHSTDKSGLKLLYDKLIELYPPIAELVTADKSKNEVAYKQSDSPLKEKYNPQPMYSLDLSSVRLLAFDLLERMSSYYSKEKSLDYGVARLSMIKLINDTFWNESEGLYVNRYVSGQWAAKVGATSFYPLLAGAVDSADKLSALMNNLTDPKRFWSVYIVPTLSIDDKQYGRKSKPDNNGKKSPPYLEYRGSILPYVNFMIYHGLTRYGLDELAGSFALKSAALWSANENDNVENYSLYLPNGKRVKKREYLSTNGNMLALIGIQELIDLEYFRADLRTDALKFGTFVSGDHTLSNLNLVGHSYSIEVNDSTTTLVMDNVNIFHSDGGKLVVRNFLLDGEGGCELMIDSHDRLSIHLNLPTKNKKTVKYFFLVPVGKSVIRAENGMVSLTPIAQIDK